MESFQGLLNPLSSCFLGEHLAEVNCLEQEFVKVEEGDRAYMNMISSLEEHSNMPFLQMLHSLQQYPQYCSFKQPISFKVQQQEQQLEGIWETTQNEAAVEMQLQPPLKSESNEPIQNPHSASVTENVCNQKRKDEGRKRKRESKKNKKEEDIEQQRMTHIAVERNRRRQMNHQLTLLKSLTPSSYIQRGDQASIIGGAIDFVKELEQLVESLEGQKRMRKKKEDVGSSSRGNGNRGDGNGIRVEKKSEEGAAEVTVVQTHVNLKIQCQRRAGQLINAIVALEKLRLTILHLNITSSHSSVLYSFNLKIEEESKIGSASEIAEAVNGIFSSINGT